MIASLEKLYLKNGTCFFLQMALPSVPVFLSISGLYDVEYRLIVACRNGFIYTIKRGNKVGRPTIELTSQPVGLLRRGKCIIVATMDQQLMCFSNKVSRITQK